MSFLNPLLLFSLLSVAVPLLIHLINLRRPQPVQFPTLQFFEELRKTSVRRIRLKEYLLLALRILGIALLAFALARPFLPSRFFGSDTSITYLLVIDNSPSMQQMDDRGTWFSQARETASEFVSKADSRSRFVVLPTNGAWALTEPVSAPEALRQLSRISGSDGAARVVQHLESLAARDLSSAGPVFCYWFSDMQTSVLQAWAVSRSRPFPFEVFAVNVSGAAQSNAAVTGLRVLSRILSERRPVQFEVSVAHFGAKPLENAFVSLEINGTVTGQYPVQLGPGATRNYVFEWTPPDTKPAEIAAYLEGDTWPFDNRRFLALDMPARKQVLVIEEVAPGSEVPFFGKLLAAANRVNEAIDIKTVSSNQVTLEDVSASAAVILNGLKDPRALPAEQLLEQVQNGRSLLFIPGNQSDQSAWNSFFKPYSAGGFTGFQGEYASFKPIAELRKPDPDLPLLRDVFELRKGEKPQLDMPAVFYIWRFEPTTAPQLLLETTTGEPVLMEQRIGQGALFISSIGVEPGWSDFPSNTFYPVFWFRMLQWMAQRESTAPKTTVLGQPFIATFPFTDTDVTLTGRDFSVKPLVQRTAGGIQVSYEGLDWVPGFFRVVAGTQSAGLAVNTDVLESDFTVATPAEARASLEKLFTRVDYFDASTASVEARDQWMARAGRGTEVWRLFVFLGLAMLVAETVLSRTFRTV